MTEAPDMRNEAVEPEGIRLGLDEPTRTAIQSFIDARFVAEDEFALFGGSSFGYASEPSFDSIALCEEGIAEEAAEGFASERRDAEAPEFKYGPYSAAPQYAMPPEPPARKKKRGGIRDAIKGLGRSKRSEAPQDAEPADQLLGTFGSAAPTVAAPKADRYAPAASAGSLASWLDGVDAPFSTTLLRLIDERGYSDVDVYKRAGMSRQLFSRIRSDASYRPAKKTVLALVIALRLNVEDARDLLARAGFALSHSDKRDLVVEYFLQKGTYDLMAVNQALYEFDQPLL